MKIIIVKSKEIVIILGLTLIMFLLAGICTTTSSADHYSEIEILVNKLGAYSLAWPVLLSLSTPINFIFMLLWQIILSIVLLAVIKIIIARIKSNQASSDNPSPPSS